MSIKEGTRKEGKMAEKYPRRSTVPHNEYAKSLATSQPLGQQNAMFPRGSRALVVKRGTCGRG